MTVPSSDPRAAQRASLRRAVLHLVFGVLLVHGVAMAVYHVAGIARAASRTQTIFVAVWTVATAITVAILLRRVRRVRFGGRRR